MNARAAPSFAALMCLALVRAGPCRALSLRSSAAESFLGDVSPGTAVSVSKATGSGLRVENSGGDPIRVEFRAVSPPPGGCKDGYDPWPHPESVRLEAKARGAELRPGEAAAADLVVTVPRDAALDGGQYEIDVVATAHDRAGASLSLKTRVLLSVGPVLPSAAEPPGGFAERPGYSASPPRAGPERVPWGRTGSDPGGGTTLKIIEAGDEDLSVSLSPVREWDGNARPEEGFEPAPNPRWLRLEPGVVKVRAGAIGRARVWASVPRQARYAGRRFFFVVALDAVAGGRRTRRYFIYHLETVRPEEKTRAR